MESQDRRAARTRRWLRSAFLELVLQKPYEEITVQDITDRADTARITFYRHYRDKEELLLDCLEGLYEELSQHLPEISLESASDPNGTAPILLLYRYLDENFQLYRTLLGGPVGALVERRLRQYIAEAAISAISAIRKDVQPESLNVPLDVLASQIAASFMGMILWWLENDRPYPMDYLARVSHWFVMMGSQGILGLPHALTPPNLHS
jgi:AcrR family transcriptional regulator